MTASDAIVLLIAAALPLMGSPGPATLSLAAIGAAYGARRGLPYYGGIIVGTTAVLVVVATGVAGVVLAIPALRPVIVVLALAYILYLAYRIATAPPVARADQNADAPSLYGGLFLAIANPKAYAAFGAVISGSQPIVADPQDDAVAKVAVLACLIVLVNGSWLVLGSTLARLFRDPRLSRLLNVTFAVLLIASVALALLV